MTNNSPSSKGQRVTRGPEVAFAHPLAPSNTHAGPSLCRGTEKGQRDSVCPQRLHRDVEPKRRASLSRVIETNMRLRTMQPLVPLTSFLPPVYGPRAVRMRAYAHRAPLLLRLQLWLPIAPCKPHLRATLSAEGTVPLSGTPSPRGQATASGMHQAHSHSRPFQAPSSAHDPLPNGRTCISLSR